MKRLIFSAVLMTMFFSSSAFGSLSVSPFYLEFDAGSPKRSEVIRMSNTTAQPKTYRIRLINYRQMPDGSYQEITEPVPGSPFASPYLGFSPHETTLEPRQSQTIRVMRKPMAAAPDGEYVSHLLMQELPEKTDAKTTSGTTGELKINIKALYGVTIPVIIDKGKLTDKGSISQAKLVKNQSHPYAQVTVNRSGTRSFWGTLVVKDGNTEIGRINNFKIFLSTPSRILKVPLSRTPSSKARVTLFDARSDAIISSLDI